ncbi:hypothetical protein BJ970_000468 [Saccharopolyspora phatthalungensis]|uniref:Uncharacterized protein n=1 Tax=Saccharopolyspora phatthalungensis TaxID=664693 RepID=A0A840PYA1_9PSEU|nr:hypothetical protein [Saccharopolyspora phatthalungensis]
MNEYQYYDIAVEQSLDARQQAQARSPSTAPTESGPF